MRLNVYGFLQFFRDFSNCFFSSLFVKNMPKHATRVKGAPGAFVREIRPINYDQPRLAPGPRHVVLGPGCAVRARIARAAGIGSRSRHQAPGLLPGVPGCAVLGSRPPAQGSCQGSCQGSRPPAQGPGTRDQGPGIAEPGPGAWDRPGVPGIADQAQAQAQAQGSRTRDRLPGPAVRGTFPGVRGPPRAAWIGGG